MPGQHCIASRPHADHCLLRPQRRERDGERVVRLGVGLPGQAVGVVFGGVSGLFEEAAEGFSLVLW
jgi:hypothetical protein